MEFRAQGAIESRSASDLTAHRQVLHLRCCASRTAGTLLGQGATEYLVLLAVVLVIALVGIALLGFFPGTASDAQITESEIYWKSASPVAIIEMGARAYTTYPAVSPAYIRVRNSGQYPIRITKLLGGGQSIAQVWISTSPPAADMSQLYYLAPGEEAYFAYAPGYGLAITREIDFALPGTAFCSSYPTITLCSAQSVCASSPPYGKLAVKDFGFEYVQYIEGQQITKREIGKPLVIKCREPY